MYIVDLLHEPVLDNLSLVLCEPHRFYISQVFQRTNRIERTKDCLWYALDLEGTRPVRSFSVLPRWV